jgi:hypothetical protein
MRCGDIALMFWPGFLHSEFALDNKEYAVGPNAQVSEYNFVVIPIRNFECENRCRSSAPARSNDRYPLNGCQKNYRDLYSGQSQDWLTKELQTRREGIATGFLETKSFLKRLGFLTRWSDTVIFEFDQ